MLISQVSQPSTILKSPVNKSLANVVPFTSLTPPQSGVIPGSGLLQAYHLPAASSENKSVWANADFAKKQKIHQMAESYKVFLDNSKTDLTTVNTMVQRAISEGFQPWPENEPGRILSPGEKFFRVNKDRSFQMIVIGQQPISQGFKMVATHIDSPHISLKAKPLQDSQNFAIFKTLVHGGIKPHQWTQRNLALVGKVVKKDGTEVNINIGNKPGDPVFIIPELAPHVDKNGTENITKEKLNPIVGSNETYALEKDKENQISNHVEQALFQQYGVTREDLINAQLDLVPADAARDVGMDRGLVSGYGSDDRSSAFAAMEALISATKYNPVPNQTIISANFGNEEVGSWNSYGAKSCDIDYLVGEILKNTTGRYSNLDVQRAFKNSLIVSADVCTAIDPVNPGAEESTNAAKLGYGPAIQKEGKLYSTPEASAKFSNMINGHQTQTFAFDQDTASGATLGIYLGSKYNADVVDFGIPVIGMHSPTEVISKADLYELTSALLSYYSK